MEEVTFIVEDGVFAADKAKLIDSCAFFEALLSERVGDDLIELRATPMMAFEQVINFVKTGELNMDSMNGSQLVDLLSLAFEYKYITLVDYISLNLTFNRLDKLDVVSVGKIFDLASLNLFTDIIQQCLDFLENQWNQIKKSIEFTSFSKNLIISLIKRDSLAEYEIYIFLAVQRWYMKNQCDDNLFVFNFIRWNLISKSQFSSCYKFVREKNILTEDQIERFQNGIFTAEEQCPQRALPTIKYEFPEDDD
ncbi:BTB/POZ domain-containing protein 9-like protein [Leptotrombidium deliense]|uniref:BTB/POZ domain-containing protein 9-like protein n=1 Tax=Leptotrombidium deliense TaxID=299467 RepID=A0A443SA82_9ACAR|nr:BTB/POZ domain-containing protein 9-like protein [Leptotrombidium deliense]